MPVDGFTRIRDRPGTMGGDKDWIGRTVLFSTVGLSPSVLTNTVWALANLKRPAIIPDEIHVVGTGLARENLCNALFAGGAWDQLRQTITDSGHDTGEKLRFGGASSHFTVLPKPDGSGDLDDIVTAADSEVVANSVMRSLRSFTSEPGTRVIASIAGGRKTLSALLTSCMSLLGRTQDILCHVLVNSPFDSGRLDPPFYFPEQRTTHKLKGERKSVRSEDAKIDLTEIPVVKVRGLYEREHSELPGEYMSLVHSVQGLAPEPENYPKIILDMRTGKIRLGEKELLLAPLEFAVVWASAEISKRERRTPLKWSEWEREIEKLFASTQIPHDVVWLHDLLEIQGSFASNLKNASHHARLKLQGIMPSEVQTRAMVPKLRPRDELTYPHDRLEIISWKG